ncbi:hypothetical protein GX586_00675 [bacterium]|nr:hypothetical protein [bacterium]
MNAPAAAAACAVLLALSSVAVTLDQVDDFEDGTTMGWSEGVASPNPPVNVASGGPAGTNDNYLGNTSSGTFGAGSRMVMFNTAQWAGNYATAGVALLTADMANLGGATLHMRIAIEGAGTRYGSTLPVVISNDSAWHAVSLPVDEAGLSVVEGAQPLAVVLSNVTELRILSSQGGPAWLGDSIAGVLGMDNLAAVIPEPAAAGAAALLLLVRVHRPHCKFRPVLLQ